MTRRNSAALAALLCLAAGGAGAVTCRARDFEGQGYTLCEVGTAEDLRLWLTGPDGQPMASFGRLQAALDARGERLVFAMNAGMYHPDRRPVGLYVEDGAELAPIVTAAGPGNFGLVPNGVFCAGTEGFRVVESRAFAAAPPACRYASQSGPMLVIGGALHPRFLPDSDSRHIRNGVGVSADGQRAVFAISDGPVNFHAFARLFRDGLGLDEALYFDGTISRLFAAGLDRADGGFPMGPIVGVVVPQ